MIVTIEVRSRNCERSGVEGDVCGGLESRRRTVICIGSSSKGGERKGADQGDCESIEAFQGVWPTYEINHKDGVGRILLSYRPTAKNSSSKDFGRQAYH
jgi:hypothetical protein